MRNVLLSTISEAKERSKVRSKMRSKIESKTIKTKGLAKRITALGLSFLLSLSFIDVTALTSVADENNPAMAVTVSLVAGEHILSVSPDSVTLVAGDDEKNSASISAVIDSENGWLFDSWTGLPEGMILEAGEGSNENTISISDSYNGELSVTLTATAKEDETSIEPSWEVYPDSSINHAYNGSAFDISARAATSSGLLSSSSFEYKWFKKVGDDFSEITGITGDTLSLRNLSDSGIYKVNASYSLTKKTGTVLTGVLEGEPFSVSIVKGAFIPTVVIDGYEQGGWEYGSGEKTLSLGGLPDDMTDAEKSDYTIYYVNGHKSAEEIRQLTGSTTQPVDAGDYTAFAVIGDSENYEGTYSAPCPFTISPKTITLTAGSGSWEYDGNAHTNPVYSPSKDEADNEFANSTESFASIQVAGSITNVGTAVNHITYALSSSTKASNYNIVCEDGTLTVTPTKLPSPAGIKWDETKPGKATWVSIAKSGVSVKYKLTLYSHNKATGEDVILPVAGENVTILEAGGIDLSEVIHLSADNSAEAKSYYFTVEAFPAGGEGKDNYASSDLGSSQQLYSATIFADNSLNGEDLSDRIERLDLGSYGSRITLIQGESVIIYGKTKTGYTLNGFISSDSTQQTGGIVKTALAAEGGVSRAKLSLSSDMTESLPNAGFTVDVKDTAPVVKSLSGENAPDLSKVRLKARVFDDLGISAYRFVLLGASNEILDPDTEWISVDASGELEVTGDVSVAGRYGIQVRDSGGNESVPNSGFSVYEFSFDPGDGSGSMSSIFKAENTAPNLPLNTFTKEHYLFKYWSGENTGISVDGAAMVANVSDRLVAQWTGEKVNYTVKYFYMKDNGEYGSEPDEVSVFQGNHGEIVTVSDPAVQKPRANYTLDESEGHDGSIELIPQPGSQGIVLNIYYKTGQYSITYGYRLPGESEDTVIVQNYFYNQLVLPPQKPVVSGYDFVGWEFEGSGAAPEKMPAKNLSATGSFKPKDATYKVVYHLETVGTGENKTGVYAVDDSLTRTLNAKSTSQVTALLSGEESSETVVAERIEGFTLKTVSVTYGAADGESLPADAESATGTVKYGDSETLYINYYYTRNVYDLSVYVYSGSRESDENRIFVLTEKHQYQELLTDIDKFTVPEYYLGQAPYTSAPAGDEGVFEMPAGYVFASYTDYSTGNKPSSMPAGNMSITKDVISNENAEFKVELYFETRTACEYELKSTLSYEYPIGGNIHIVADKTDDEGNNIYLAYNDFVKTVNNYGYYSHVLISEADGNGNLSKEEGVVAKDGSLVLKVYFERKSTTATINYKYRAAGGEDTIIASYKVTGKWGTGYFFDPDLLFNVTTEEEARAEVEALGGNITTPVVFYDGGLEKDFKSENYLISYTGHYRYLDGNGTVVNTYPSYTFKSIGSGETIIPGYPTGVPNDAGIKDIITNYFSIDDEAGNNVTISYNQISEKEDFYLDLRIINRNLKDKNFTWWTNLGGAKHITKTYADNTTAVPIHYGYDSNGDDENEYYQVRVINKCAVVTAAGKNSAAGGIDEYPAANAESRSYNYDGIDLTDIANLHPGCIYIEDNYFFYDPAKNTEDKSGAFGNEPVVFKVDPTDRFLQGAFVSYGIGGKPKAGETITKEREFSNEFLESYQSAHDENSGKYEAERTALAYYSTSYGGAYVQGDHAYLNVYFYYRENCRLSFYFNGQYYSDQEANSYIYGSVVPKEDVKCDSVDARTGYDVVWYTDDKFTKPIPDAGLTMDRNRTVYGRYEKSIVRNMEYIYYQLADPVSVNGNVYNYITQDNFDEVKEKLESEGKSLESTISEKQINLGTASEPLFKAAKTIKYTLSGAPVFTSIERPTLTYTEITLSKGSADYEAYYLDGNSGFFFDETNTDNRSFGYVSTTPLNLKVYFARDQYTVLVHANRSETDNPEYRKFSIGQHVQLPAPLRDGYTFREWNWKKQSGDTFVDYSPVPLAGESYFKMPGFNLMAIAQYDPAAFDQRIIHLYRTDEGIYLTDFIANHTTAESTADVTFGDTVYENADIWGETTAPTAVRIVTASGDELYFGSATYAAGRISVTESDLVARISTVSVTSEEEIDFRSFAYPDSDLFGYSYGLYKDGVSVISSKSTSETPLAKYGMTIELYYARNANYRVALSGVTSGDGGSVNGITLIGEGTYFYGETVTVSAVLREGHTFIGWFKADDIENGIIKAGAHALSTNTSMDYLVKGSTNLVALIRTEEVVAPKLRFLGKDEYTYGYADSADNTITAIASTVFAAGDPECEGLSGDEIAEKNTQALKTKITGYQWYIVSLNEDGTEDISVPAGEVTTSATYRFTPGKNAGTYTYRLKIMFERTDNGRTGSLTKDFDVLVKKAPMSVTANAYTGTYDNRDHSISLKVNKPASAGDYEVYYHPDTEITAENLTSLDGITQAVPSYRHVKVDDTGAKTAHTTYIYIKDKTGNYEDYVSSREVRIVPKTVSIKPTNNIFSKMYDGDRTVNGSVTEEGSDLYRLSRGEFYTVQGYVDGDTDTRAYFLDCNANYNTEHVRTAKVFVVSDMKIVNNNGDVINDYVFPTNTTLSFTGTITPRPLDIEWVLPEEIREVAGESVPYYTYNGEPQGPGIRLSEVQTYAIPAIDTGISDTLSVSNKQDNVGTYSAVPAVTVNATSHYESSDYSFSVPNRKYIIEKRPVVVTPVSKTVTYNGQRQTITEYTVTGIVTGHTTTAQSAKSYVDAGVYEDMTMKGLVVKDARGRIKDDNYDVTYAPATLTVLKCPVTASGVTIGEKIFDGTTTVETVNVSGAVFTPLYTNALTGVRDSLALDASKISAEFTDENAGNSVNVNISIPSNALINAPGKDCLKNYVLDEAGCQRAAAAKISKKPLYVTANDKEMKYKIGDENEEVPAFDWSVSGFVEGWGDEESFASELGIISTYITKKNTEDRFVPTKQTLVGEYDIKLENKPVLDNYEIVFKKGTFRVSPSKVYVSAGNLKDLITLSAKTYDGNTDVLPGQITLTDRERFIDDLADPSKGHDRSLLPEDAVYLREHPEVEVVRFIPADSYYTDSKNVGASKPVFVSYELGDWLSDRYELEDTDNNATAGITPAALSITPDDLEITYGLQRPASAAYTYTATGLVAGETIEGCADFTGRLFFSCDAYSDTLGAYSEVNLTEGYPVSVSGISNGNYEITYNPGKLLVKRASLSANKPVWNYMKPGTISFSPSKAVGDVSAAGYELSLFKDGVSVETVDVSADVNSYDFSSKMHEAAGSYSVKIKAIASTVNNASKMNVSDSGAVTSDSKETVRVRVSFADEVTSEKGEKIEIGGELSDPVYVSYKGDTAIYNDLFVIGGEHLNFVTVLSVDTGYTPAYTVTSQKGAGDETESDHLKFVSTPAYREKNGESLYEDELLVADETADHTENLFVRVGLVKAPARISGRLEASLEYAIHGFTEAEAPVIFARMQKAAEDNIDISGYDFKYTWYVEDTENTQFENEGRNLKLEDSSENTFALPAFGDDGENLPLGIERYKVSCRVTATRKDNGESAALDLGPVALSVKQPVPDAKSEESLKDKDDGTDLSNESNKNAAQEESDKKDESLSNPSQSSENTVPQPVKTDERKEPDETKPEEIAGKETKIQTDVNESETEPEKNEPQTTASLPPLPENYIGTDDGLLIIIGTEAKDKADDLLIGCRVVGAEIARMLDELVSDEEKAPLTGDVRIIFRVEVNKTGPEAAKALEKAKDFLGDGKSIAESFDSTFYLTIQGKEERKIDEKYSFVRVLVEMPEELRGSFKEGAKILRVGCGEDGSPYAEYVDYSITNGYIEMDIDNYSTYVVVKEADGCFIHWLILLLFVFIVLIVIIYYSGRGNEKKDDKKEEKEEEKKYENRKLGFHFLLVAGFNAFAFILAIFFGQCRLDIPAALFDLAGTILFEVIFYNATKKEAEKDKKEAAN